MGECCWTALKFILALNALGLTWLTIVEMKALGSDVTFLGGTQVNANQDRLFI